MIRRSLRFAGLSLALTVLAALPAGSFAAPGPPFRMPRLVETTLDNGLHVVVCPRPGVGLVDVRIALRVGTWLEGEYQGSGISHYFEHLVAGGATATRSEAESKAILRSIGALKAARTDVDRTWVYITTTPEGLGRAVLLLADWVVNPALDPSAVDREKGVILRELDMYRDHDARRAWELLHAVAFTRHPARLPLQGFMEPFEAITRADLVAFHRAHYVPGNAVVAVVGDVAAETALDLVRDAFSGWKVGLVPDARLPAEPPQRERRFAHRDGKGQRASVALGWRSVALDHEDMIVLDTLKEIVGAGRNSRLMRRVVDEEGLAASLSVLSRTPALGGGLFTVLAQVAPGDEPRLERIVQEEFDRIAAGGVTGPELERARRRMEADILFGFEEVEELAQTLTRDYSQTGDCRFSETYLERLEEVTVERIRSVAARYLKADALTVAVVGPPGEQEEAAAEPTAERPAVVALDLGNGSRARLLRTPGTGLVAVHAALAGGVSAEDAGTNGAAQILAELVLRGGRQEISSGLARIEERGGTAVCSADRFSLGLTVRVLDDDLDLALDFLEQALGDVAVDPDVFEAARRRAMGRAARRRAWFESDAEDRLYGLLFPQSPYGLPLCGSESSLAGLEAAAVEALASRLLTAENLVVAVVGDFEIEAVAARLARFELPRAGAPLAPRSPAPALEPAGRTVFVDDSRGQVTLALVYPGAAVGAAEDRIALDLIDAWSSGRRIPSGPLFDALRGDRDLAYYVHALNMPMPGAGFFYVLAQCAPERYPEVLETLRATVTALAAAGMQEEDLTAARNQVLAARQTVTQTAAVRARMLALGGVYGLPADSEDQFRRGLAEVRLEYVNAIARLTFQEEGLLLVLWPEGVPKP